jgi:DNA-binding beta-propeller fold protein YncE
VLAAALPREIARVALPDVDGRLDHLALDASTRRLFVAALGNGTVEVVDLGQARRVARVDGFREPQGVLWLAATGQLFVTEGGGAGVTILAGGDLTRAGRVALREDADNIRYEPGADRLWVGAGGNGSGVLAAFGPKDRQVVAEIALDGHPESFQLEASSPRVFVNVPRKHEVEVVDRERRRVVARWSLPHAANFPMALDERRGRLFVGCRRPARIVVLDTATGRVVDEVDGPADADDVFLDPEQDRLYVSGGEGFVRVYARRGADRLGVVGDLPTGPGARTSLLVPALHRLYVAVPSRGTAPAEILVFETPR